MRSFIPLKMRNIQNGSMINLFLQAHMNDIKAAARVTLKICRFHKRFGTKTPGLRIQRKEIIKRTALL